VLPKALPAAKIEECSADNTKNLHRPRVTKGRPGCVRDGSGRFMRPIDAVIYPPLAGCEKGPFPDENLLIFHLQEIGNIKRNPVLKACDKYDRQIPENSSREYHQRLYLLKS